MDSGFLGILLIYRPLIYSFIHLVTFLAGILSDIYQAFNAVQNALMDA